MTDELRAHRLEGIKAIIGDGFLVRRGLDTGLRVRALLDACKLRPAEVFRMLQHNPRSDLCDILACIGAKPVWIDAFLLLACVCLRGVMCFGHVELIMQVLAVFRSQDNIVGYMFGLVLKHSDIGLETALPLGWLARQLPVAAHRMHFFSLVASRTRALPFGPALLAACARNFNLVFYDHVQVKLELNEVAILANELQVPGPPIGAFAPVPPLEWDDERPAKRVRISDDVVVVS